jgi:glutathione S-transferase
MCGAIILIRYETWLRPEPMRWKGWLDDRWSKIWSGLAWFERGADGILLERLDAVDVSHLGLGCLPGLHRFPILRDQLANSLPATGSLVSANLSTPLACQHDAAEPTAALTARPNMRVLMNPD